MPATGDILRPKSIKQLIRRAAVVVVIPAFRIPSSETSKVEVKFCETHNYIVCTHSHDLNMSFHFSAVLSGHSKDVRCLASIPDPASSSGGSCIISGSRDCTVKLWHQDNSTSPPVWEERLTFAGHQKYVSCVAAQLPNDKFPEVNVENMQVMSAAQI